jgi:Universal stress protein family
MLLRGRPKTDAMLVLQGPGTSENTDFQHAVEESKVRRRQARGGGSVTYRGPLVLGVPWTVPPVLVRAGAELAAALDVHLVCAYVDPSSVLTEWEPLRTRTAASLDPVVNEEALYPAGDVRARLTSLLGPQGTTWSFRELHGDVSSALARLGGSAGACMLMVGNGRAGVLAKLGRTLEGAVADRLIRIQDRPVVVVPQCTAGQGTGNWFIPGSWPGGGV